MRTLAVTLLATVLTGQATAEFEIVVPSEYADAEAPLSNLPSSGFSNGYRFQTLYDSSLFGSLPASQQMLTGFYFRPDRSQRRAGSATWDDFTIKVSTTSATASTLSTVFAANHGPDEIVAREGPITVSTANLGPDGGPKEFDIAIEFQTPFNYDPTQGNLLVDWIVVGGPTTWVGNDSAPAVGTVSFVSNYDNPNALEGEIEVSQLGVVRFNFVPEPSTAIMAALAGVAFVARRRRKGTAT